MKHQQEYFVIKKGHFSTQTLRIEPFLAFLISIELTKLVDEIWCQMLKVGGYRVETCSTN